jgi:hypothetical protein
VASSFPILFGAPSFGDEDRDQWIRVLQLFLQDPFAPHAVTVGGETQVQYGWTVPPGAISSGGNYTYSNNFGIRELNPFSGTSTFSDNATISDRAGVLFAFSDNYSKGAIYILYDEGSTVAFSNDPSYFGSVRDEASLNIYWDGGNWRIQSYGSDVYLCITSMGPQI